MDLERSIGENLRYHRKGTDTTSRLIPLGLGIEAQYCITENRTIGCNVRRSVVFGSLYAVENAQELSLDEVDKDKVDRCVIKH